MWQLLRVEKIQNDGRCYGNQGPKWRPKHKCPPIWAKFCLQVDYDVASWYPSLVCYGGHFESKITAKIQTSSDLGEIWFPSRLWCCELISFVWEPYYDPSDNIISCYYYYYYYYSSSSRLELVRPNSQRLMIWSLLNFTGRWIPISKGALMSWNFLNGCRCHGKREHMSKYLTSLISETAKGISTRLGIYIKLGW